MEHEKRPGGGVSRREFLGAAAGALAAGALAAGAQEPAIPRRVLGRTGFEASILALGIGAMGDGGLPAETVQEVISGALDAGINYIDAAPTYGSAQAFAGPVIEARRSEMFLVSKIRPMPDKAAARATLEKSLSDLRTDHFDLVHLHNIGDFAPEQVDGPEGALTMLREAKEEGLVRHLGVSGHHTPSRFPKLYEAAPDLDVTMFPLNIIDRGIYAFESAVRPAAVEHGLAVVAMKLLGGVPGWQYAPGRGRLATDEWYERAFRYTLHLEHVVTAVVGFSSLEELSRGVEMAKSAQPFTEEELAALEGPCGQVAAEWGLHYGSAE